MRGHGVGQTLQRVFEFQHHQEGLEKFREASKKKLVHPHSVIDLLTQDRSSETIGHHIPWHSEYSE